MAINSNIETAIVAVISQIIAGLRAFTGMFARRARERAEELAICEAAAAKNRGYTAADIQRYSMRSRPAGYSQAEIERYDLPASGRLQAVKAAATAPARAATGYTAAQLDRYAQRPAGRMQAVKAAGVAPR